MVSPVRDSSDFLVRFRSNRAFSLIEITLAIGIVSFAFLGLFGLLPVGLEVFRGAMDRSVRTQIVQRIVLDAQQTDFDVLQAQTEDLRRYFDEEGTEFKENGPGFERYIYTSSLTVQPETVLPQTATSKNLLTLTVKIARNPGHVAEPFAPAGKVPFTVSTAFVARKQ